MANIRQQRGRDIATLSKLPPKTIDPMKCRQEKIAPQEVPIGIKAVLISIKGHFDKSGRFREKRNKMTNMKSFFGKRQSQIATEDAV